MARPIGRRHHLVIDCRDPARVAAFWSAVLGEPITYADDDFVVVAESDRALGLAFQRARDFQTPTWPDPAVPQQVHLDVMVDDVDAATTQVLGLGATALAETVFADPDGHPFCLIPRPDWAAPTGS